MKRCFATVVSRNYLAQARALAASLRRHHAEPLVVLCVDDPAGYFQPAGEPFQTLAFSDVMPPDMRGMTFYYTAFELCNALKAYLVRHLLRTGGYDEVVYLDSDIQVLDSLTPAFDELATGAEVLLTPHLLEPVTRDLAFPAETAVLQAGIFNAGFMAFANAPAALRSLDWLCDRMEFLCLNAERDVFVDQRWLNHLPYFFPGVTPWRHRGANVAYWNIHERAITRAGDGFRADGEPLLFWHASMWQPGSGDDWTLGRSPKVGTDPAALVDLCRNYDAELRRAGLDECRHWPYGHGRFGDGSTVSPQMRRWYYWEIVSGRRPAGDPFDHPEWFQAYRWRERLKPFVPLGLVRFLRALVR